MAMTGPGAGPEQPPARHAADGGLPGGYQSRPWAPRLAPGTAAEHILVVAVCAGQRCRALRALRDPSAAGNGTSELLRQAVRRRPRSVLVSTGCLGPCARGCVAAVGTGSAASGELRWTGRPVGLGMVEMPQRAAALAGWITGSAPDLATLPETLWSEGAS
jgi:hypothetical protein